VSGFPWLPIGTALPGGEVSGRLLDGGEAWQLCATLGGFALLLRPGEGVWQAELQALAAARAPAEVAGAAGLLCLRLASSARPATLERLALRNPALGREEADALAAALSAMQRRQPRAGWSSALFLPDPPFVLATDEADDDRRAALVGVLTGGVRDPALPPRRIAQLNPRLDAATISRLLGLLADAPTRHRPAPSPDGFTLPGQPALETLLREQVLDVLHRPQDYARLGVAPPGGVLLAGPPGCGKSFAAARLARFLGWPLHEVAIAEVGSAWLHETPRRLAEAFDAAAAAAPAIMLLEELDALGRTRTAGGGPAAEEVNTLLRLVEAAPGRGLLVVGTTNRPEAIDPALRRHGRFDILHVMDHADAGSTEAMLRELLSTRPHGPALDLPGLARRLARRPASDVAWVVNEAARLAVRGGRDAIDDLLLARAAAALDR